MVSPRFGDFGSFCRDSTLPVCNLLSSSHNQSGPWDTDASCQLRGIPLSNGNRLGNLGSILLCAVAIVASIYLIMRSERKRAAVGRREMQVFLSAYVVLSLCEIFTVGEFPLSSRVRIAFTGIHIGFVIATAWLLMLNAVVGYQVLDDGTPVSLGLLVGSAAVLLLGTGYIALDTGYSWTGYWDASYAAPHFRHVALYVLYQLVPLILFVAYYVLEAFLVLRVLGETRPMIYLTLAALLFALGQVFNYAVSPRICAGTAGKIDGALFETLFTLMAVVMNWVFWSSITEDDWPMPVGNRYS